MAPQMTRWRPPRLVAAGLVLAGMWTTGPSRGQPVQDCPCEPAGASVPGPDCPGAPGGGARLPVPGPGCPGYGTRPTCPGIPCGAIPAPSGYYVRLWQAAEVTKADADDFVIYRREWFDNGLDLGPCGRAHLRQIVQRLPAVPFPVVIEPEPRDEVNEARRQLIIQYLALHDVPDAAPRVVVDFPLALGLYGDEAPRIFNQYLRGGGGGAGIRGGGAPFGGFGGSLGINSRGLGGFGGGLGGYP